MLAVNNNMVVNKINDSKVLRLKDIAVEKILIEKDNLLEYCEVNILHFDPLRYSSQKWSLAL